MLSFFSQMYLEDTTSDSFKLVQNLMQGFENLRHLREEDIDIGVTPKEAVYREEKLVLYHFKPMVEQPFHIPILIVYALVNRPFMVDLQEDRSLVLNLLKLGLDVYLIDWGYPTRADRWLTLDDYINDYLDNCVDIVRKKHGLEKINLLGICQGGTFSLCYAALYPEKIQNLIVMVAPVDFHVPGSLLNLWGGSGLGSAVFNADLMVETFGNVPGDYLNLEFLMLKPQQLGIQKYIDFLEIAIDENKLLNFLRMEKWIFDSPDQAGEAYREFIKDFYQGNKLIHGEVKIEGKRVDLKNLQMPILNLYAQKDHLVPPESSLALENYVGSKDYTVHSFPVGHIGMYVSGKVQQNLPPIIANWVKAR